MCDTADKKIDPRVIMETLHSRIAKDVSDASKHLSAVELVGVLYTILQDVTMQGLYHNTQEAKNK